GRVASLAGLFPEAVTTAHDGELVDTFIAGPSPSVVMMNPPFARSLERGVDGQAAMRHLRSAWRAAASGARIEAVMPEGFHAEQFAAADPDLSLLLKARIAGAFRKAGTGIPVRLVVFDKRASSTRPVAAEIESHADLDALLAELPARREAASNVVRLAERAPIAPVRARDGRRPVAPFPARVAAAPAFEVLEYRVLEQPASTPEQAGLYLSYRPSRIAIDGAPVHPTPLVESVAMGSVTAPVPDSRPLVPRGWRDRALLSEAQCETLVYAASAFVRDLPGRYRASREGTSLELADDGTPYRQGFFLGDGTGAGKGRQITAVIMDRWLAGERRHIWISKNEALVEDARRDWEALGGLAVDVQPLSRWKLGAPLALSEGILFATYPTLRSGRAEDTRLDQVLAWAGETFDGVIAFDEAHAMANALGGTTERGKVAGSEQGMAGLRLQNRLPRARVLYASATGASDIANLGYTS